MDELWDDNAFQESPFEAAEWPIGYAVLWIMWRTRSNADRAWQEALAFKGMPDKIASDRDQTGSFRDAKAALWEALHLDKIYSTAGFLGLGEGNGVQLHVRIPPTEWCPRLYFEGLNLRSGERGFLAVTLSSAVAREIWPEGDVCAVPAPVPSKPNLQRTIQSLGGDKKQQNSIANKVNGWAAEYWRSKGSPTSGNELKDVLSEVGRRWGNNPVGYDGRKTATSEHLKHNTSVKGTGPSKYVKTLVSHKLAYSKQAS